MTDRFPRESGILLHPTSLPGPHGIGDLGDAAFRFVDWLERAGQRLWQVMPLGPTGFGDSPYASPSAFAGNPLLVSLSWLGGEGLLEPSDWHDTPGFPDDRVDFEQVAPFRWRMLRRAYDRFRRGAASDQRQLFTAFCEEQKRWLDDYALFMALKSHYDGLAWTDWPEETRLRHPDALDRMRQELAQEVRFHQFVQFQFRRQWTALKRYANDRGVRIIGDIPIFVSGDSTDVWTNQREFKLDEQGRTVEVAGVPPDPFSATGQIWGNPVFDWKVMRDSGYAWWVDRIRVMLDTVDIVRIDHFRGFAAAWVVPADADTAEVGHWERSPGAEVFAAIREELGEVPIIVEDLGVITPDVVSLREALGFPGMKVLQFAFENDPTNIYLPHNYEPDSAVYTATHDNQTTVGWFRSRSDQERAAVQSYLGKDGSDIAWDLIRTALSSISRTAIVPMQDVLRLDDYARMNVPGQPSGNWSWRMRWDQMDDGFATGLRQLVTIYGRGETRQRNEPNPWDYTTPGTSHPASDPFA
ncbi:MAG TPA: 4-alpha-glucanotransferase [Thermomicrobiales bacterium]|nr:4-alpha-glucanotransferase [Thermomicrobiales bacterium]